MCGRIKPCLSSNIPIEQFGFLVDMNIHEVVGTSQDCLHTIKNKENPAKAIKIDLSKSYDQTCWLYIRLVTI